MKTSLRRLPGFFLLAFLALAASPGFGADAASPGYHLLKEIAVPTDGLSLIHI